MRDGRKKGMLGYLLVYRSSAGMFNNGGNIYVTLKIHSLLLITNQHGDDRNEKDATMYQGANVSLVFPLNYPGP
ncbi:hypothetical protein GDO81_015823 [Engystomops pustulosus]|uniref:Uncharacterized protein n=1 Tax=Engystomops pustulosus TaxID=76066 RepID=A0AAV7APV4_ENGPU|nr:hypothetical protein GDO81_015823 [Engystomops pustulosus]